MLAAEELSSIRASYEANLQAPVWETHITGYTNTPEGSTPIYSAQVQSVCRYSEMGGSELIRAQQIAPEAELQVFLPAGFDVRSTSHLSVQREDATLLELEVVYVKQRTREFQRIVYARASQAGAIPTFTTLVERAAYAAANSDWRRLGVLPSLGWYFHESEIIEADNYLYLFNTEGDGNVPGWNVTNVLSWSCPGVGQPATIILSGPHGIPANGRTLGAARRSSSLTATSGTVGNLNSINGLVCYATNQFTLVAISLADTLGTALTANGSGGAVGSLVPVLNPQVGVHRVTGANALTDLTDTLDQDYVSRVAVSLYYPTVVYITGSPPMWYLFGTNTVPSITRQSFSGTWPSSIKAFAGSATITTLATLFDIHIRQNPVDGAFYCVGTPYADPSTPQVFKTTDIAANSWGDGVTPGTPLVSNIWADIDTPACASVSTFDASIAFLHGRVYFLFTGYDGAIGSLGIVELSSTTYKAIGNPVVLHSSATRYSWEGPSAMSDQVFVHCPDAIDRIFAFTGGPYDGTGQGVWGCLEMP